MWAIQKASAFSFVFQRHRRFEMNLVNLACGHLNCRFQIESLQFGADSSTRNQKIAWAQEWIDDHLREQRGRGQKMYAHHVVVMLSQKAFYRGVPCFFFGRRFFVVQALAQIFTCALRHLSFSLLPTVAFTAHFHCCHCFNLFIYLFLNGERSCGTCKL